MKKSYDVVIVGAGPAGLFAARELIEGHLDVLVIDKGAEIKKRKCPLSRVRECVRCDPCNLLCGVGGAGAFSDGTLNLRPDVGGDLVAQTGDDKLAWALVKYVDKVFQEYGAPERLYRPRPKDIKDLKRKAAGVGVKYIEIDQRHIGSDNAPRVIANFERDLIERGVEFMVNTTVTNLKINSGKCVGVVAGKTRLDARAVILAPGRVGASFISKIVRRCKLEAEHGPIDIGVRVEVPGIIMDPVTDINRDPKFHIRTRQYDDLVRTFCTNPHGYVVKEEYEGYISTNGHSMANEQSENTNFALLVRVELTQPIENTTSYGISAAKLATTIGGGKPILQRMGDLRMGRRSTPQRIKRNAVTNTLGDITPGDISMALPHRVVTDLIEGLDTLNDIIPGVASDATLLYAPEVKFYAMKIAVDKRFQSSIDNLFVAGDGGGLSRDMVNASATGVLAARGILATL